MLYLSKHLSFMKERSSVILQAIVRSFIDTANPVGSRYLQEQFGFPFSPATIRSEMGNLEEAGMIASPHTSAGRVPTEKGFRFFVAHCHDDVAKVRPNVERQFTQQVEEYLRKKRHDEKVYDAVSVLTSMTPNVAFGTVPSTERMFFLGFSNVLRQPEFSSQPDIASGVFRVLEHNFQTVLESLDIADGIEPQIFIGSENVITEIQSCSLIVSKFSAGKRPGFLGILGPIRMDYARNIVAIEAAHSFLASA